MPGFDIKNETIWPLEISLGMLSPLYWGITEPNQTFSRGTGAVWFTIQATVALDHKEHITKLNAVFDVFKSIIFPQIMLGDWLFNDKMLAEANLISEDVANALNANTPITIKGRPLNVMSPEEMKSALQGIFSSNMSRVSKAGCYAGISGHKQYVIKGGPSLTRNNIGNIELVAEKPLSISQV